MGRKCCIIFCKGNYDEKSKEKVFRLPSEKRNSQERTRWIKSLPNLIHVSKHTCICERHWPPDYKTISVHGKLRPVDPPSIFQGVKKSIVPTRPDKPRTTVKSSSEARNRKEDQLKAFQMKDKVSFKTLVKEAATRDYVEKVISYVVDDTLILQSCSFFTHAVPSFLIKIKASLKYETYAAGIRCTVPFLSKNKMSTMNSWSKLEEAIRYLHHRPLTHKMLVIKEQMDAMGSKKPGEKFYSPDSIVCAFQYRSVSNSCYEKMRVDYQLPSTRVLRSITSKVDKVSDQNFLLKVFANLEPNQRSCIILVDEVYVKPSLQFHGGSVFGKAENDSSSLATTMLAIMIKCMNGGPNFIIKMIPVSKLTSKFLYKQVSQILEMIQISTGNAVAIITDNNRTNQAFFKMFDTSEMKPWRTRDGLFLLFDYVHLLKSIRNN